jgi:ADP-ribosylation factor GTPase-activating protein 2/3
VVTDVVAATPRDGTSTPAEAGDDFFSSWDKPSIKRPSNPPSRTQTPPVISRTASPFLNPGPNGNGQARSKSPLQGSESDSSKVPSRAVPSTVIRKSAGTGAPRKANILGAKKTKLGAKKVGVEEVDFEAAEKKAKEEADRIEKLGYDPEAEEAAAQKTMRSASITEKTKIAAPTPVNPSKGVYGPAKGHERTKSEMERLGMGMSRLGFGQVGGSKPAAAAPKKMGFGAVGSRAVEEGTSKLAWLR